MKLDLLVTNANILTLDPERPRAHSVGVWNGLIVGVDEEVAGLACAEHIDARGATLTPGFHDVHNHMSAFGQQLREIDAAPMRSLEELYDAVARRARELPAGEWITGSGYDQTLLGAHPTRAGLDAAGGGRPVMIIHRTCHLLAASTAVFERAGALAAGYRVPDGGFIERDPDGAPSGVVGEQAMAPFRDLLKPVPEAQLVDALALAAEHYLTEGLTSVTEAGIGASPIIGSSPVELAAYQRGHESGRLRLRTEVMIAMDNIHEVGAAAEDGYGLGLDLGLRTGLGSDRLRIGALKVFTDGALMSRTAAMTENFCGHDHAGVMQFEPGRLERLCTDAHRAGWQLAVHAIGDHAVDVALDVIAAAQRAFPRADARHRIEHASVVRPDQLPRFAELEVIPSPQGRFISEIGDGVASVVGPERLPWTYRHRSFLDLGLCVPGGSDRPVVQGAPLPAMQAMVERRTSSGAPFSPGEAVTALEALESYTVHSAYASRDEHRRGQIRPRMLADFVLLGADPTAVDAGEIGAIPVLATCVGGELVYDAR